MRTAIFTFIATLFFTTANAQLTGTLLDKDGEIMRGHPMIISKQWTGATDFALAPSNWQTLKDSSINTVRLCWVGSWVEDRMGEPGFGWITGVWTMPELANVVDSCVALATQHDMNIIINYHNVGEQENTEGYVSVEDQNMERLTEFWATLAPRYNGNDRVLYEITNEPWFFGTGYEAQPFMNNFLSVYDTVRTLAPQQQLLMFTFNSMSWDFQSIMAAYDPFIDWDYTSVAYHMYSTDISDSVVNLSQTHRVMCSEFFYESHDNQWNLIRQVDGYEYNAQSLEVIGHSWCDWKDWTDTSFDLLFGELYPDALAKGYAWWLGVHLDITSPADGSVYYVGDTIDINLEVIANTSDLDSLQIEVNDSTLISTTDTLVNLEFITNKVDTLTFEIIGVDTDGKTTVKTITVYVKATFYDCNNDLNGSAYLDSCGVCAGGNTGITPCPYCVNSISNDEFDSSLSDWSPYVAPEANGSITVKQGLSMSGTNAVHIEIDSGGTADWHLLLERPFPMTAGETYYVSFLAKADAARTIFSGFQETGGSWSWHSYNTIPISTILTRYDFNFTATSTDATSKFKFLFGLNTSDVYIDDVWVSNCDENTITGLHSDTKPSDSIIAYPNPTYGLVRFSKSTKYEVCDIYGKSLIRGKGAEVDLSNFSSGNYLIKTDSGVIQVSKL